MLETEDNDAMCPPNMFKDLQMASFRSNYVIYISDESYSIIIKGDFSVKFASPELLAAFYLT